MVEHRYCFCSIPGSNCPVLLLRLTMVSEVTSRDHPSLGRKWRQRTLTLRCGTSPAHGSLANIEWLPCLMKWSQPWCSNPQLPLFPSQSHLSAGQVVGVSWDTSDGLTQDDAVCKHISLQRVGSHGGALQPRGDVPTILQGLSTSPCRTTLGFWHLITRGIANSFPLGAP